MKIMSHKGNFTMNNREKCYDIIDSFNDEQLINVMSLLLSVKNLVDKSADDTFCLRLFDDYQNNSDKGEPMDIKEFANDLGVSL